MPRENRRAGLPAVLSLTLSAFVSVTTELLPIGALPTIGRDLGLTTGESGLLITLPAATAAASAFGTVLVVRSLDRRLVLCGLTALLVAVNVLSGLAPNAAVLFAARALLGVVVGGFWSIGVGVSARLMGADRETVATAVLLGGISLATVLGAPLATLGVAAVGWRNAFLVLAAAAVVALVAQLLSLPRLPGAEVTTPRDMVALVVRRPAVRVVLTATTLLVGGHFVAFTFVTPYLQSLAGFPVTTVSVLLFGFGVAGVVGNAGATALLARSLPATVRTMAVLLAGAIAAAPFVVPAVVPVAAVVAVWGLASGALPLVQQTWIRRAAGESVEAATSLNTGVFQLMIAFGSLVGGLLVDLTDLATTFVAAAVVVLAAVPLAGRGRTG